MPKKFLHSLLQAIFITLVAFMIMDFILMPLGIRQGYLGGEPHFFAVIGGMMLVCTGVRILVAQCFSSHRLRRILLSILLHIGSIFAIKLIDYLFWLELGVYLDFAVVFHSLTLILSLLTPTAIPAKIAGVAALVIMFVYLGVVFLLPLRWSGQMGYISGDWATLNALREAKNAGLLCKELMQDPVLFPQPWDCDFPLDPRQVISRDLKFYPDVLVWWDGGRLHSYDFQWLSYD